MISLRIPQFMAAQDWNALEGMRVKLIHGPKPRRGGAAKPGVEEHAKRALEPWVPGPDRSQALKGRSKLLRRPFRALFLLRF